MLSRFERHQAASYGAVTVPSKTMCRQTLTTLDGTERHRRFYLALGRLEFCASPFVCGPLPKCDHARGEPSRSAARLQFSRHSAMVPWSPSLDTSQRSLER